MKSRPAVFFLKKRGGVVLHNDPEQVTGFSRNAQTLQLLVKQAPFVLFTCVLLAIYIGVLYAFQSRGTFDDNGKTIYNSLTTALLIALGLNFFGVFKTAAKVMRWRILSGRLVEPRRADLILGADSLMSSLHLIKEFWYKPTVVILAAAWLIFNLGAQAVVALIQLNVSVEGGTNSSGITTAAKMVSVPKLDCFYSPSTKPDTCPDGLDPQDPSAAHAFGETRQQKSDGCTYVGDAQSIEGRQDCLYFSRQDNREFAVRFPDYNADDKLGIYPNLRTGRLLTVAATNCLAMDIMVNSPPGTNPTTQGGPDGNESEFSYTFPFGPSDQGEVSISRASLAAESTTYIWNGVYLPGNKTRPLLAPEPRTIILFAIRDFFASEYHNITTFKCEVKLSNVSNAVEASAHQVSDGVARTAGAAIALTGRWRILNYAEQPNQTNILYDWRQFQLYQNGSDWAAANDATADEVGALMSEFAASSIATLERRNPRTDVPGMKPDLGNHLQVTWGYVSALAGGIACAHALLVVLILILVRSVVVGDASFLVVSRVLGNVVVDLQAEDDKENERLKDKELADELAGLAKKWDEDHYTQATESIEMTGGRHRNQGEASAFLA